MRCTMQSDCAYTRAGVVPCGEQAHLQRRNSPPGCTELGTQKVRITCTISTPSSTDHPSSSARQPSITGTLRAPAAAELSACDASTEHAPLTLRVRRVTGHRSPYLAGHGAHVAQMSEDRTPLSATRVVCVWRMCGLRCSALQLRVQTMFW